MWRSLMTTLGLALTLAAPPLVADAAPPAPIPVPRLDPVKVFDMMAKRTTVNQGALTLVLAHRGIHQEPGCAENSYCAIRSAYEAGADGVELDVKLAKPAVAGQLGPTVLGHDNAVGRELVSWPGKTKEWNLFGSSPFPLNDPQYRDLSKLPFLYDLGHKNNPDNPKRSDMEVGPLKAQFLKDQFDRPTTDNQIGVKEALEYIVDNNYSMMIWLDVKNLDSLKASIAEIKQVRAAKGNPAVLKNIGFKLGWGVIEGTPDPNLIPGFETDGLHYLFVFGTGEFDAMAKWSREVDFYAENVFTKQVAHAFFKYCTAVNKCLGAELAHKYSGAPTQAIFEYVRDRGSRPWQVAGFHTVPQYEWYTHGLATEQRATAYGRWYPRTDGSCCFSPTDTLNNSPRYSLEAFSTPEVDTSESHDLRPSYSWSAHFSFVTTDDPRRLLRELRAGGNRPDSIMTNLGDTTHIPSGGDPANFGPLLDGVYQFGDAPYLLRDYANGSPPDFSGSATCATDCMWYVRNYPNQKYTITNALTSRSLYYDYNALKLKTTALHDSPLLLWTFSQSATTGKWRMVSTVTYPDMRLTSLSAPLQELTWTRGPPGYAFCADGLDRPPPPAGATIFCETRGPATVAWGRKDRWTYKAFETGPVTCTRSAFDVDPKPDGFEACFFAPRIPANATTTGLSSYFASQACATEGAQCSTGTRARVVAFGLRRANGAMAFAYYEVAANKTFTCDLSQVSNDPAFGEVKACYLSLDTAPVTTNGPPGYLPCAPVNETCAFEGTALVAFGRGGAYTYKTLANSAACQLATFAVDPIDGTKLCFYKPMGPPRLDAFGGNCGAEHGSCDLGTITSMVAYGLDKRWAFKGGLTGSVGCDNATFGDPNQGANKVCRSSRSDWLVCASEGSTCTGLPRGSVVAYGMPAGFDDAVSRLIFVPHLEGGSVECNSTAFGTDPAPGYAKHCFYKVLPLSAAPPPGYTWCVDEALPGQPATTCLLGAGRSAQMAFGAYGQFIYASSQTGDFTCSSTSFAGNIDPYPHVRKGCYYRLY